MWSHFDYRLLPTISLVPPVPPLLPPFLLIYFPPHHLANQDLINIQEPKKESPRVNESQLESTQVNDSQRAVTRGVALLESLSWRAWNSTFRSPSPIPLLSQPTPVPPFLEFLNTNSLLSFNSSSHNNNSHINLLPPPPPSLYLLLLYRL